jgi:mRNA interferase YafQ
MRELVKRKRFDAELRRAIRRGLSRDDVEHLFYLLAKYDQLPEGYDEHPLTDNWQGQWDCHLEGDLVVVYKRTAKTVILVGIGTHRELFPHRKRPRRKRGLWGRFLGG